MKKFCQYLSFISLLCGLNAPSNASQNVVGCALNTERQSFTSLSEFDTNKEPLIGYFCEFKPKRSTYLGDWFPSLPQFSISQSKRLLTNDDSPETDDYSQSGYIDLAIKRLGNSQLVLHAELKEWQYVLTANTTTPYVSRETSNAQNAIRILSGQQAQLLYTQKSIGLSFIFPYQHQTLTQITLQQIMIKQPVIANIIEFPNNSLYNAEAILTEIGIQSHSYHSGLNINWGIALASGSFKLNNSSIFKADKDYDDIIGLNGELELYYQHNINQHWFAFGQWQGALRYWLQEKSDNSDYKLAEVQNIEQALRAGFSYRF